MAEIKYIAHVNLNGNEIRKVALENLASHPSAPVSGQIYWNTTDNAPYIYTGSAWIRIDGDISDVQGTTPIQVSVNASGVATVSISPATSSSAGSMSAADKAKLDASTSSNTPSTLVERDSNGNISIADPTAAYHAATKGYVDTAIQGLDVKASVRAASTANITVSGLQTIDGVTLSSGDRCLVKDQTNPAENGIYLVSTGAWTRASDMDTWDEVPGAFVFVETGTTNADTGWVCTSDPGGTLGTTAITWSQFSGAGMIEAGAGLLKTGNVIDVQAADNTIQVNADSIQVKRKSAGGLQVDASGMYVENYTPVTNTVVARRYEQTGVSVGNTPGTQTITHNLNSRSVQVQVYDDGTYEELLCEVVRDTLNSIQITANGATRTVRVVVTG